MRHPLVVYVSGSPGSGKSTLADLLARELYLPRVSSDLVHAGVRLTQGSANDRYKSFHEGFVPLMIQMTVMNISFVVDHVAQHSMTEQDVIAKLASHAFIVNIHAKSTNPIERHIARELARTDKGVYMTHDELEARAEFHKSNLAKTNDPLEIDMPQLVVATDDGYEPSLARIVEFIEKHYPRRIYE